MKSTSPLPLLVLLAAAAACDEPPAAPSKPGAAPSPSPSPSAGVGAKARKVQVETEVVRAQTFEDKVEVTGALEAVDDATLSAQSAGTVQRLVDLGAEVRRGQVLASLDAELLAASVRQAEAQLAVARSAAALTEDNYERQKPLRDEGVISALEFENIDAQRNQARAQVSQAEAALAQAKKQLSNSRVTAPFEGIVEERFVELGEQVNPGQPIVRVTNTRAMTVKAGIPERYAAEIEKGASIDVAFNAYGLEPREARLTFVGRTINAQNRTFTVEAELDNPDGKLKPEMVARLLVTRAELKDALTLPLAAVVRDEGGEAVFVVDRAEGGPRAARQRVKTGASSKARVVILEGLSPGDEVVVAGQSNLTRGDLLDIKDDKAAARAEKR